MKTAAQRTREYFRHLGAFRVAEGALLRIPGVVRVAIGCKSIGGTFLRDEMCFQAFVRKKLPRRALSGRQLVPAHVHGFDVDVLEEFDFDVVPHRGFGDIFDRTNYKVKVGGMRITNSLGVDGTMGCFAKRVSDGKTVMLSNAHVMVTAEAKFQAYSQQTLDNAVNLLNIKIFQPKQSKSCCCTCNEIGKVVNAKAFPLDCAIAELYDDVPFYDKVRRINRYDGTVELTGVYSGFGPPIPGNDVWKVGVTTGLTRGFVPSGAQTHPRTIIYPDTNDSFGDPGDSGSVVVDTVTQKVVGLYVGSPLGNDKLGVMIPMDTVASQLGIEIVGDLSLANREVSGEEDVLDLPAESPFAAVANRLRQSPLAVPINSVVRDHLDEMFALVNESRPGKVGWQRLMGPSYVAAFARSAKEPAYRIPREIEGVSRETALAQLGDMLSQHGSEALQRDLALYGPELRELFLRHDSVAAMIDASEAGRFPVSAA